MRTQISNPSHSSLSIRLLGPYQIQIDGQTLSLRHSRKEQWLLALLVLRQGRIVERDWLAETLWPDSNRSRVLLRDTLYDLRQTLGSHAERLRSPTRQTLQLDLQGADVDVLAFDAALIRGDLSSLERAIRLYQGALLEGCAEEWVHPEREAREKGYLTALEILSARAISDGQSTAAVHWLRLLLATDPYRESACCALMQALADCGDQAAITQVYRDLRLLLRRDLNTDPAPETDALYRSLRTRRSRPVVLPPASPLPTAPPHHLPVPLSNLIGREQEIEEVGGWLSRSRLITLVGTGGVGKTRLSLAVAERVIGQFSDGVWFVDLAPLSAPSPITQTLLRVLDLKEEPSRTPEETLEQALRSRKLLLVMDNCEHLLEFCASLIHRLLSVCPDLRVLATSREALGLTGEHLYCVPSLALPSTEEADVEKAASSLLEYAAVRLFVERARQANSSFRLSRSNAEWVLHICERLDGIPLAIEMAAARLKSLSVGQIAARLEDRFALLTGGSRAALPRQRTLQATLDWSYDLLSEEERTLFRRLSVFAGGWSLEAAEAVCAGVGCRGSHPLGPVAGVGTLGIGTNASAPDASGIEDARSQCDLRPPTPDTRHPMEVLNLLTSLVGKSLVVFEKAAEGTVRYRLLETRWQGDIEPWEEVGEARYRLLETLRQMLLSFLQIPMVGPEPSHGTRQMQSGLHALGIVAAPGYRAAKVVMLHL